MDDDSYRALLENEHLVVQLTEQPGWAVLVDWLHQRMRHTKQELLDGRISSHEDYRNATGYLQGIHAVIDAPAHISELAENERGRRREKDAARRAER